MATPSVDPDSSRVFNALRSLVRAIGAGSRTSSNSNGISGAQAFALRQIAQSPGMHIGELANRTLARQSSVSELVGKLVDAGLVLRRTDANDARQATLHLTARGKKVASASSPSIQERLIQGLTRLPHNQRKTLAEALDAWVTASGLENIPPTMFFEDPDE